MGCQFKPWQLGPVRASRRQQSLIQQAPCIYVLWRALGNVPGVVPPHLSQQKMMCSASPGFTLTLSPLAVAFWNHPEDRSVAVLHCSATCPEPWLCLHLPSLSALPGSLRADVIATSCGTLFLAAHGKGPPPLPGPLQRSLEHALAQRAACQGATLPLPGGSLKVPEHRTTFSLEVAMVL